MSSISIKTTVPTIPKRIVPIYNVRTPSVDESSKQVLLEQNITSLENIRQEKDDRLRTKHLLLTAIIYRSS